MPLTAIYVVKQAVTAPFSRVSNFLYIWHGQEHVFKIYFLTNELVTSQHEDLTSQHKDLSRRHKDLSSQHNFLTSDSRSMPPYFITRKIFNISSFGKLSHNLWGKTF